MKFYLLTIEYDSLDLNPLSFVKQICPVLLNFHFFINERLDWSHFFIEYLLQISQSFGSFRYPTKRIGNDPKKKCDKSRLSFIRK